MANDERFRNNSDPTQSARNGYEVVPSDTEQLPTVPREILITADGILAFVWAGYANEQVNLATDVQTLEVVKGDRFPWAIRYITTATTAEVYAVY